MKQPIFITCMGGTGSSLLTKIFKACGMSVGNENTYFFDRWTNDTCQHDLFTALVHMYKEEQNFDLKWRTRGLKHEWGVLDSKCPGTIEDKMRNILIRYVDEAEANGWNCFGIKDTRATENLSKWREVVYMIKMIWGKDTIFVTTVRDPITYIHRLFKDERFLPTKGEHLIQYLRVCETWRWMLDFERNSRFVAYPQAFDDGSVKQIVKGIGLPWPSEAGRIYKRRVPTRVSGDLIDDFMETFSNAETAIKNYNNIVEEIGREDCIIPINK